MDIFEQLKKMGCSVEQCGSTVTCNPPPTDTDTDYLVFVTDDIPFGSDHHDKKKMSEIVNFLDKEGFQFDGDDHYQNENAFNSFTKGNINLIVSRHYSFVEKHRLATKVCKRLNLMEKKDRIVLFQAILYNNAPTENF